MRIVVLVLSVLLLGAAPASAQQTDVAGGVGEAVEAFRAGDPVYVAPEARDLVPESQEEGLQEQIEAAGGGIRLAVFAPEAGLANQIGAQIVGAIDESGTYGVVAGTPDGEDLRFAAASDQIRGGGAATLAQQAVQDSDGSVPAALAQFVTSVEDARASGGEIPGEGAGAGFFAFLAIAVLGGTAFAFVQGRKRRRRLEEQMADVRRAAEEDLLALGSDIRALDLDIEMPGVSDEARQRYGEAVEAYTRAEAAMSRARTPQDFEPIGRELEEGRYDIAAARAALEGREAPERRPPCFFDPRHGPSVTDVEWAPPGGEPRPVPVCAADAVRLEEGEEPHSREIVAHGQRLPYWQAPQQFAPFYAAGMFGGFGGLATGMLFGSMLGGAMYGGWGAGDAWAGSDWGGGDFGGGGFGGGFGGGDFGGGGFGGGDF